LTAHRYVYDFDEPSEGGRELLGGKGVGLAEMTQLGVPVPAGFTITTDACRAYRSAGKALPDGLGDEIDTHLEGLERKTGKRFGDTSDPLLVSVRSGAAVSMPGMMDTILNLGLNDETVKALVRATSQVSETPEVIGVTTAKSEGGAKRATGYDLTPPKSIIVEPTSSTYCEPGQ